MDRPGRTAGTVLGSTATAMKRRWAGLPLMTPEHRPVFPAPLGGWRDPCNTQADLRDAFATAGLVSPAVAEAGRRSVAAGRLAGSPPW